MTKASESLEKRIRRHYDELPGSERCLADLILEFPSDILVYSATALSERANVSKAAVTRLIQRLGYSDYREMQREVRDAQQSGDPVYLNTSRFAEVPPSDRFKQHVERDILNIRQTYSNVSDKDVAAVVQCALSAKRVWVIGFRNSYFFASYIRRQLIQIRPSVVLLPQAGQVISEDLGEATSGDLIIIIGLRRRVAQLHALMEVLSSRQIPIAYVTDRGAVSTSKLATWVFSCHTQGTSLFDSYTGVISLLSYLCTEIMAKAEDRGRRRLSAIEDLVSALGELETIK